MKSPPHYRAFIATGLILLEASYFQKVLSTSSIRNGATTISQLCLPRGQRRQIEVSGVSLVCDQQFLEEEDEKNEDDGIRHGYGYANKPTCLAGDLGKISIEFSLRNEMPHNSTIYMSMEAFSHGRGVTVRNRTDLCSYSNLGFVGKDGFYYESIESVSLCPLREGVHYLLLTSFTVPELFHLDAYMEFVPSLVLLFHATPDTMSPLVGCVETGALAQISLERQRSDRGAIALIISIFCFVATFALCLHGYSRRRKAANLLEENRIATIIQRSRTKKKMTGYSAATINVVPSLSEARPVSSSSNGICRSMSSSHDPPRSRSERTISTVASAKKSCSGRSEHSIRLLHPKDDSVI